MTTTVDDSALTPNVRYQARPTTYNGVTMRSRLEAGFAQWLDKLTLAWEYEPQAFGHAMHGQYLPDFVLRNVLDLWSGNVVDVYVEVKPNSFAGAEMLDHMDRAAAIVQSNEPNAHMMYAIRTGQGRGLLMQKSPTGDWDRCCFAVVGGAPVLMPWNVIDPGPWVGKWWKGES